MTSQHIFKVADYVHVVNCQMHKHHRVPMYLKGKTGQITAILGAYANPEKLSFFDTKSGDISVYRVCFSHAHLWGGEGVDEVFADLMETWIEPVKETQ
ncbi:MAG: nitrile hydratase subunit beta [Candidatus Puniceispirillum sp.]|jgi:nitrile hydratase subunit beta|uniref:Putative ScnA-like protein n=1 Tax=Puniceispirillum marinum (strain IMCC1322) TaxID=488538 RepID=D5BMD1_PUNMI|nr:SH3-like domain-containing protein [Candidatus Puniceispirillum marinum]ADE39974.1 putative ScnA-like protein [Candidatus Puniceispirillum marinum IMCC1322]MBT6123044.1 nitrile hydratase subunit beta [Candidatus Puniceispirillum sp.]